MYNPENDLFPAPIPEPEEYVPEDQTVNIVSEEDEAVPALAPVRRRRTTTPKEVCRSMDELRVAPIKSMNLTELRTIVSIQAEQIQILNNKCEELDKTAKKAFEQFRNADESYRKLENDTNARFSQMRDLSRVFYQTMQMYGGK